MSIAILLGMLASSITIILYCKSYLESLKEDLNEQMSRMEKDQKEQRIRTDHLYEILISIVKDQKTH